MSGAARVHSLAASLYASLAALFCSSCVSSALTHTLCHVSQAVASRGASSPAGPAAARLGKGDAGVSGRRAVGAPDSDTGDEPLTFEDRVSRVLAASDAVLRNAAHRGDKDGGGATPSASPGRGSPTAHGAQAREVVSPLKAGRASPPGSPVTQSDNVAATVAADDALEAWRRQRRVR